MFGGAVATGIGRRFAEARAAAGLTQKELARRVGVAPSTISGYETEERGVDVADVVKIAKATGFHHHYLAFGELPRRSDEEPTASPPPPPLDPDLLYQCIASLERVIARDNLQMSPDSKAGAIVGLYQTQAHLPPGAGVAAELEGAIRRARK